MDYQSASILFAIVMLGFGYGCFYFLSMIFDTKMTGDARREVLSLAIFMSAAFLLAGSAFGVGLGWKFDSVYTPHGIFLVLAVVAAASEMVYAAKNGVAWRTTLAFAALLLIGATLYKYV